MIDALTKVSSYLGLSQVVKNTSAKKAADEVVTLVRGALSTANVDKQDLPFSYCLYPAGLTQASKVMCVTTDVALNEFKILVQNCSATRAPDQACASLANAMPYGECGNRAYCNLLYNGPINSCFNDALNATVPSCLSEPTTTPSLTTAPSGSLPGGAIVGITFAAIGLFTAGLVLIVKNSKKIGQVFSQCCCCRHLGYNRLLDKPLQTDSSQVKDHDTL